MDNTNFYKLLLSAKDNSKDMEKILLEVMPIIDKNSLTMYEEFTYIDEDLKNGLIEYLIRLIKSNSFANKLAKNNENE